MSLILFRKICVLQRPTSGVDPPGLVVHSRGALMALFHVERLITGVVLDGRLPAKAGCPHCRSRGRHLRQRECAGRGAPIQARIAGDWCCDCLRGGDLVAYRFMALPADKDVAHDDPRASEVSVPVNGLGGNDNTRSGFALAPFEHAAQSYVSRRGHYDCRNRRNAAVFV
jgi:hypothetical protein